MLKIFISLSLLLLLTACGGGASQHEPREEKTLYFIDAPTNGIDYSCGERTGVTKTSTENARTEYGLFKCVYSPVHFSLGALELGTIENISNKQVIYPQNLIPSFDGDFNNESLLKIAILLQSLDDKRDSEHINIPQSTKDKITFTSLNNLSIEELYEEIRKMGFTPVDKDTAKVHLLLNSPNVHTGKPTLKAFEEDISGDLTVGNIIGELDFTKGDGELIFPFILEGEGKENFLLNNKGKLILTQTLDATKTYTLDVMISNEFGYASAPLILHIKDSGKIGKAQMGRLQDAKVKLFKLGEDNKLELLTTERTVNSGSLNQIGNFDLHTELLEDQNYYIYEVSEGIDIDSDDNGEKDTTSTKNQGKLHLISKGIWLKNINNKIRITPLSEMLYTYVKRNTFKDLEIKLQEYSKILLKESLDNDNIIEAKDIMIFNPLIHKKLLYPTLTYNNTYNNITHQIRAGNNIYKTNIFNAYVIESFQSNAIEIVGSTIYTVDMLESGEFNIYDLETKEKIGGLKLPNTPVKEDSHVIYVNLVDSDIKIGSLVNFTYNLNIRNQKKPILYENPFINYSILSGNLHQIAIGKSYTKNLFSKEGVFYLYDISQNNTSTQEINLLNINENTSIYQSKFDSTLHTIDSLWIYQDYLYIIGDNKIKIFQKNNKKIILKNTYDTKISRGNILGIENKVLYLLDEFNLTLFDVSLPSTPKCIDTLNVPFKYKLGIKTSGDYITTGSKIIDIKALRASKTSK